MEQMGEISEKLQVMTEEYEPKTLEEEMQTAMLQHSIKNGDKVVRITLEDIFF